jgi:Zn-dependent protease with chaperone function
MSVVDRYLEEIQENTIQELEPITTGTIAIGSAAVIANFIILLTATSSLSKQGKVEPKVSKKINHIMNSGNKWIVHVYPDNFPNAFSLGFGRHLFITSKLLDLLSKDELMAVLLHEVYHSTKKHTYKFLAYKYPLFYLTSLIAMSTAMTTGLFYLGFLAFFIANSVGNIVYNIVFSKRMEYNADSFAVKRGYGKDLISAIAKIGNYVEKITRTQKCGKVCQVIKKIDQVIDAHPAIYKRIRKILEQSDKIYNVVKSNSYGKIKDFITKAWGK